MWQSLQRLTVFFPLMLRLALGGAFVLAGALKLAQPQVLAATMDAFGLVPEPWTMPLARLLPPAEIAAGTALMLGRAWGLHAVSALLAVFVAVLAYGLHLGLDIDCGCYGPADPTGQAMAGLRPALYRDLAMLAMAALLYARGARNLRRPPSAP